MPLRGKNNGRYSGREWGTFSVGKNGVSKGKRWWIVRTDNDDFPAEKGWVFRGKTAILWGERWIVRTNNDDFSGEKGWVFKGKTAILWGERWIVRTNNNDFPGEKGWVFRGNNRDYAGRTVDCPNGKNEFLTVVAGEEKPGRVIRRLPV
jgi:hypothetical protein